MCVCMLWRGNVWILVQCDRLFGVHLHSVACWKMNKWVNGHGFHYDLTSNGNWKHRLNIFTYTHKHIYAYIHAYMRKYNFKHTYTHYLSVSFCLARRVFPFSHEYCWVFHFYTRYTQTHISVHVSSFRFTLRSSRRSIEIKKRRKGK